ncbi:glycoside hydrolase family protein [Rhizobium leucaenae]|uniref:glycoside hydrolase family protein n=1 Tax=Rhizobium leucaenae TaxID=29450 RepID=UPI0007EE35BF|nr:glycoside hydrolase [Rhizobium leucaenae]
MPINKLRATPRAKALIASIVAVSIGGYVAIFPGQPKVHDDVALAIKTAMPWEGRSLVAYFDRIAKPPVWTICDGDTDDVRPGMVETPAGCDQRTAMKMEKRFRPALVSCVTNWGHQPLAWRGMILSLSWNIGTGAACHSSAVRIVNDAVRLNAEPDYIASCNAATAFNKAGNRVRVGLVNRREMGDATRVGEGELCVSGL